MDIDGSSAWAELSFLAEPGSLGDWRMVLLYAAAADASLIEALPGRPDDLAARLGLDGRAVRVLLDALAVWGIVEGGEGAPYVAGRAVPSPDEAAVIRHHARSLRLWSANVDDRLRGVPPEPPQPGDPEVRRRQLGLWLDALAVNARRSAPAVVDACLERIPAAARALDLGGGHGEYALELARRGLKTTMQDRPEVVELARQRGRLETAGVELFAGNFFELLPALPFDVVLCAGVTFTYGADANRTVFRQLKAIVAPIGVLAVHTFLGGRHPLSAVFAVQMLMATPDGDTHREEHYREWLAEAGYRSVKVLELERPPESLVLAFP